MKKQKESKVTKRSKSKDQDKNKPILIKTDLNQNKKIQSKASKVIKSSLTQITEEEKQQTVADEDSGEDEVEMMSFG